METQQEVTERTEKMMPTVIEPEARDLIAEWLGEFAGDGTPVRHNLDLSTFEGVALMTKLLTDSPHQNATLNGKEFVVTACAISTGQTIDGKTGEQKLWPRTAIACQDGTHLVFGGIVAFRSALFMLASIKPERWRDGLKVRVHAKASGQGGIMHRLEVIP